MEKPPMRAPNPSGSPAARRLLCSIIGAAAPVLALLVSACGNDSDPITGPPTARQPAPALAVAAAGALSFRQVMAGDAHTCGLTTDSLAYCWGDNSNGQLGDGTTTDRLTPVKVAGGLRFAQITAGGGHTCALTRSNVAYCWGHNSRGQIGDGTYVTHHTIPTLVAGGRRFHQIRAGFVHTCALNLNDAAYCWGANDNGQLGTSGPTRAPALVRGGHRFRQVITGASHTCAVTRDDRAYCWGNNASGQLGNGTFGTRRFEPVAVAGGLSFRQVVPGSGGYVELEPFVVDGAHTCGITTNDKAYCWGETFGSTPHDVSGERRFRQITTSAVRTACAVALTRAALCWSWSDSRWVRVPGDVDFSALSTSALGRHICGLSTDRRAYCWGSNSNGQLGDGTRTDRSSPTPVAAGS
jgi:alpha-tubulin suppressor-like RCC1 family protein